MVKPINFIDSSLDDLRAFPIDARREAGYQLDKVQHGEDPDNWKPMTSIGSGVREIRIKDAIGIYRVMYIAKFEEAVYVLHCFVKKTQTTRHQDIELAKNRLNKLIKERNQ
ncbi:type II toxin-antitoxin system RelE/ParE family toxin [Photorhabdus asymbiotica]|uniref:type II toxin-antitoxin system RelE/ParE family toxin n=1 Tax=Photorhabdus asymbiotica TaxID=291112 RepID=UPI003DA79421